MDAGRRGVQLLERLTGRRAHLIRVVHTLMVGRPFHCWSSAQQTDQGHAAQTLAKFHQEQRAAGNGGAVGHDPARLRVATWKP
jgi:hypothetical protein